MPTYVSSGNPNNSDGFRFQATGFVSSSSRSLGNGRSISPFASGGIGFRGINIGGVNTVTGTVRDLSDIIDENNDGNYTDQEILNFLLKSRRIGVERIYDLLGPAEEARLDNLVDAISKIDKYRDGKISDKEIVEAELDLRRGADSELASIDPAIREFLLDKNVDRAGINNLVDNLDTNTNGYLDDIEVLNTILEMKNNDIPIIGWDEEILSINENYDDIYRLIHSTNFDSLDTNEKIYNFMLRIGSTEIRDLIKGQITDPNVDVDAVVDIVNALDADGSKQISIEELIRGYLNEAGNLDSTLFNELVVDKGDFSRLIDFVDTHMRANNISEADLEVVLEHFGELDSNNDGIITNQDYTQLMIAVAKGNKDALPTVAQNYIDAYINTNPELPGVMVSQIVQDMITEFQDTFGPGDNTPIEDLVTKFRNVILSGGNIDNDRLFVAAEIVNMFYPNALNLIDAYTRFNSDPSDPINESEIIDGLLAYRAGEIDGVNDAIINKIISGYAEGAEIKYILEQFDTTRDGEISDTELVQALVKIKSGNYDGDEDFNEALALRILGDINPNFGDIDGILSNFSYDENQNLSNQDLATKLLVDEFVAGAQIAEPARGIFLEAIGMDDNEDDLTEISNLIQSLEDEDAGDTVFTQVNGKTVLDIDFIYDKLVNQARGEDLAGGDYLTSIFKSNGDFTRINRLFNRYIPNGEFGSLSAVKMVSDYLLDDADSPNKLSQADYDFFIRKANEAGAGLNFAYYEEAINVLDPDHNGKMTYHQYVAHSFYFSDRFNQAIPANYDFNGNNVVDETDRQIFLTAANYLRFA